MEKKEKLNFPIAGHQACPMCSCENRLGEMKIQELVEDGVLDPAIFSSGPAFQIMLRDPRKPITMGLLDIQKPKVPFLQYFYDVCANPDCLHLYVTKVDFVEQEVNLPQLPMTGQAVKKFGGKI